MTEEKSDKVKRESRAQLAVISKCDSSTLESDKITVLSIFLLNTVQA